MLSSPDSQAALITQAQHYAAQAAVAAAQAKGQIPASGPQHDAAVAAITKAAEAQATQLVEKVLDALRHSLGIGIAHGLFVVVLVGLGMLVTTFFLKDVPLAKSFQSTTPAPPRRTPAHRPTRARCRSAGSVPARCPFTSIAALVYCGGRCSLCFAMWGHDGAYG